MGKPVISLAQGKAHLRVEHELDDDLIQLFLDAAIDRTLQEIGLAGVLEVPAHETPSSCRKFGFRYPVESLTAVEKLGSGGEYATVPAEEYELTGNFDTGHVIEFDEAAGHRNGDTFRVTWRAGMPNPPPAWFRVAVFFLLAHYYENRSSVIIGQGVAAIEVPQGFAHLTAPHRRWFFA
jgi:uncharacterized phiE125 gp8 family phage protein